MSENNVGCPPMYKTPEEMQKVIDKYFEDCNGEYIIVDGCAVTDKAGNPVKTKERPLTITGLALALGFSGRQALLNYEGKSEFVDTIKRAKSRIEQYAEERLFDKDGVNGAKFNLSNNFKGWNEKQQIDSNVNTIGTTVVKFEGEISEWAK
ncbi:MAG: hypothetical protein IJ300_09765 [Clostridia bacterium]|nr:hypothetical protein [Clostridia bacterium]